METTISVPLEKKMRVTFKKKNIQTSIILLCGKTRRLRRRDVQGCFQKNFWHFAICFLVLSISLPFAGFFPVNAAETDSLCIVLDPGHGGDQSGAARGSVEEKDLNLKIAEYLKEELETYENVEVFLTRTGDYDVELEDRTQYSADKEADVMISLHNNAAGECAPYYNGCTVLAAKDGYKDKLAGEEQKLACNILNELSELGIENQGILLRDSEAGETYDNGVLADYYAIIRGGVLNDIPSVLIEHAFLDDDDDYENYLSSDEKLRELARADCRGIARYYQLAKKSAGEALKPLVNYREKLVHIVDGHAENNEISYKTYYQETTSVETGENASDIEEESGQALQTGETAGQDGKTALGEAETFAGMSASADSFEDFVRKNPPEKYVSPLE